MRSTNAMFKAAMMLKGPEQASMLITIRFELATILTLGKGLNVLVKDGLIELDPAVASGMNRATAALEEIFSDLENRLAGDQHLTLAEIYAKFEPLAERTNRWRELAKKGDNGGCIE